MTQENMTVATYTGTPLEIGQQVFARYCLPVIKGASQTPGVDGDQMAHLYVGFLQSCMGSLAADFGHEQAIELVDMLAETFKKADLGAPAAHTH